MEAALGNAADVVTAYERLVSRLLQQAPPRTRRIFVNAEMRDSASGMAASADVFSVVKAVLGRAQRCQGMLDADSLNILSTVARYLMRGAGQDFVTIDLIIDDKGKYKVFVDYGPLRRLAGEHFFKQKHKHYAAQDDLLAAVE
jgi:hypothetical protein